LLYEKREEKRKSGDIHPSVRKKRFGKAGTSTPLSEKREKRGHPPLCPKKAVYLRALIVKAAHLRVSLFLLLFLSVPLVS